MWAHHVFQSIDFNNLSICAGTGAGIEEYDTQDSGYRNRSPPSLLYRLQQLSIIPGTAGEIEGYDTDPIAGMQI
jgi:hypothetical protein